MMAPRWRKALADVTARRGRSALAVIAMTIGVASLGTLAIEYALMDPVLKSMKGGTQPASAIFYTDRLDDALVRAVQEVPGVGSAEARPVIMARINPVGTGPDNWIPAILYVIRDFEQQEIDLCLANEGTWPPGPAEVLLERTAEQVANTSPGNALRLRVPGLGETELLFSGTAYAAGLAPAWMEHVVYGFIPWDSTLRTGSQRESSQLLMRVAEHDLEVGHIDEVAERVKLKIEALGYTVRRVEVPPPGVHPHAVQMKSFMFLVAAFALLVFLLSATLVASMIHTLQNEQIKQVGMMKAIGARSSQIAGVYLAHVGVLIAASLAIGLPIAWYGGRAYANFSARILNADLSQSPFPWLAMLAIAGVSLVVPLLVSLVPVLRSARISVREALAHDSGARPYGFNRFERWLTQIPGLSRPLALVLRTTLQRRARLALTLGMLAVGGAIFMAAINVSLGWDRRINADVDRQGQDMTVWFEEPQPALETERLLTALPTVKRTESWSVWTPFMVDDKGVANKRVVVWGVSPGSELYRPNLSSGEWLQDAVPDGVVINNHVVAVNRSLVVGDSLTLRVKGRTGRFPIVGITEDIVPSPSIYMSREQALAVSGQTGEEIHSIHVVAQEEGEAAQLETAAEIERTLAAANVEIKRMDRRDDLRGAMLDHVVIIQTILILAAGIVVLIGGLGLGSTLMVSVLQRTREFGIMSAIGARPKTMAAHVWFEGLLIGVLSWFMALALATPVGTMLGSVTGKLFFNTPIPVSHSAEATVGWLVIVVVLGSVTSFYPARKAASLTIRKAFSHV